MVQRRTSSAHSPFGRPSSSYCSGAFEPTRSRSAAGLRHQHIEGRHRQIEGPHQHTCSRHHRINGRNPRIEGRPRYIDGRHQHTSVSDVIPFVLFQMLGRGRAHPSRIYCRCFSSAVWRGLARLIRMRRINMQQIRGGLVLKARRPCVSLDSRLESYREEEEERRS